VLTHLWKTVDVIFRLVFFCVYKKCSYCYLDVLCLMKLFHLKIFCHLWEEIKVTKGYV